MPRGIPRRLPQAVFLRRRKGPPKLTPQSREIVDEAGAQPWYDAVCRLWDDAAAARLYDEQTLRRRYADYIESLCPDFVLPSADAGFRSDGTV